MSAAAVAPASSASALDWALYYARRGWSVVPVRRGEKMPAIPWQQFQHRRASDAEIRDWFTDPTMGVGIVTGAISGLFVVDFDGEQGATTHARLARQLGIGPTSLTGGGGTHVLFRHPGQRVPTRKALAPGMDIRGDGGFIVAPPSVHASGHPYAWDVDLHPDDIALYDAPAEFVAAICAGAPPGPGSVAPVTRAPGPLGLPTGTIEDGREQYMRNTVLAVARDLYDRLARLPTPEELFAEAWPQYSQRVDLSRPGRGEGEFRAKVTYTVARLARGAIPGFTSPAAGPEPVGDAAPGGGAGQPKTPLPLVYFEDAEPNLDAADFVEGVLTEGGMSVLYGESNCGKTFFATDLALHVALGRKWNGREVEQGGVIYCALEGSHGILNRVAAFRRHHYLDGQDIPFAVIPVTLNLLDPNADAARLIETIEAAKGRMKMPVKLVVFDTLSRAMAGGNENAPDDMGALVANDTRIRQATGAHGLWIHHSGKDSAKGARGHSLLRAATDTEIEIVRENKDAPSIATVRKQRDMEIEGEWAFRLEPIELGRNKRGKPVTSCIVQVQEAPTEGAPQRRLTGHTATAYRILVDAGAEAGVPGFGVPEGCLSVPEDWWRERFYARAMPGAPQDSKKRTFRRAADALVEMCLVATLNGRVWTV